MIDNARITELETQIVFLESTIQELSDVVARQQKQMDVLLGAQQKIYARLEEVSQGKGDTPEIELPPHY